MTAHVCESAWIPRCVIDELADISAVLVGHMHGPRALHLLDSAETRRVILAALARHHAAH